MGCESGARGVEADEGRARRLRREVRLLAARELRVSRAVASAEHALARLSADHGAGAYITYADLRSIREFRNQTVIPIKAPPDTRLSVSMRGRPRRSREGEGSPALGTLQAAFLAM